MPAPTDLVPRHHDGACQHFLQASPSRPSAIWPLDAAHDVCTLGIYGDFGAVSPKSHFWGDPTKVDSHATSFWACWVSPDAAGAVPSHRPRGSCR